VWAGRHWGLNLTWQCFVEIVEVVSNIAMTIIAGVGVWIAYMTLLRMPTQETESEKGGSLKSETTIFSEVKVFETSKQTTWLKVTDQGLECYLYERRSNKGGLQWILTKGEAKEILSKGNYWVHPGYSLNSGVFSIGPRRNWLYSKKIYPEPNLLDLDLKKLLEKAST
jgi:hypothetical protein